MGSDCDWSEQLRVKPLAVRTLVVATLSTDGPDPVAVHQPRIVELVDRISAQTMEVEPLSLGDMDICCCPVRHSTTVSTISRSVGPKAFP